MTTETIIPVAEPTPAVEDTTTTDKNPPRLHIMMFDARGRPRERALCGAKISAIYEGGAATCKECVEIRMKIDNGKGWAKL